MGDEGFAAATIPGVVDDAAVRFGGLDALVDDERSLSFAALAPSVDEAAAGLIASGVRAGDRVAIWAPSSVEWAIAALAVYAAGAVLVPVNTRLKVAEVKHILDTAGAELVLTVPRLLDIDFLAMLEAARPLRSVREVVTLGAETGPGATPWADLLARADDAARAEVAARKAAIGPDDICDLVFTSGTTGLPKGVMLRHGASIRAYLAWTEHLGLAEGDRFLVVFPFFQTSGLKAGILACILRGAANVPQAVFDVDDVVRRIARHRISVLPGPPTVFQVLLDAADAGADVSSLRLAVTGGATTPVALVERMQRDLGLEGVVTAYGLTETTGLVSMCRSGDPAELIATSVGRPIPGVEVKAVDREGREVADGEPGELLVRGYQVMAGYFENPEATAAAIEPDGWMHTGDIGTVTGGIVRITDRLKDMFIVGGFNVYPAEVEAVLLQRPEVGQVAVVGVPDDRLGEVGAAFVVPAPEQAVDPDELHGWCREVMANYKVPRTVHVVDALPLNANGKVLKYELRARAEAGR